MTVEQEQIAALERKVGPDARSPLFARLAELYLNDGRAEDALRLCDSGLANHPYYTTGHLIKGKVLLSLNMPTEARRHFEIVVDFLPGSQAVRDLLASIPPPVEETLVVPEPPPVEEKPKRRIEDMFQQITAEPPPAKALEEPPLPPQPEEPVQISDFIESAPSAEVAVPQELPADEGFGLPAEPASVDAYSFAPAETVEHVLPPEFAAPPAEPASEEPPPSSAERPPAHDFFGGISGYTPDTTVEFQPAYVEPEAPTGAVLFGEMPPSEAPPAAEPSSIVQQEEPAPFTGFGFPEPPPMVEEVLPVPAPSPEPVPAEGEMLFSGPMDGDTYEKFALRMRAEMSGENTMTLEDFYSGAAPKPVGPKPGTESGIKKDRIEEFADKLQDAKKITPVINFSQKAAVIASEEDMPTSTGFVTPTLAEIYAKQGWYDDAIKAYRTLMVTKPNERERFEKRIAELEELKTKSGE